jgi:hypothetical protein
MDSLTPPLDALGRSIVERAYEPAFDYARGELVGRWRSARSLDLQRVLATLDAAQREAAFDLSKAAVITALHGLLHGVSHGAPRVRLLWDGADVGEISDGLQGDLFAWLEEFSSDPPLAPDLDTRA